MITGVFSFDPVSFTPANRWFLTGKSNSEI